MVSNGASITVTDNEGRQPLHWALQSHSKYKMFDDKHWFRHVIFKHLIGIVIFLQNI